VTSRPLLLSIRPRHAAAIVEGRKTVEVRRRRVAAPPATLVILYASSAVRAVVGTARLAGTLTCAADEVWQYHASSLALERGELAEYLKGAEACLLFLEDVRPLATPLSIAELRRQAPFQPPQSYRYLKATDPVSLAALAKPAPARRTTAGLDVTGLRSGYLRLVPRPSTSS
jgi:predicted transcriptional regulator